MASGHAIGRFLFLRGSRIHLASHLSSGSSVQAYMKLERPRSLTGA